MGRQWRSSSRVESQHGSSGLARAGRARTHPRQRALHPLGAPVRLSEVHRRSNARRRGPRAEGARDRDRGVRLGCGLQYSGRSDRAGRRAPVARPTARGPTPRPTIARSSSRFRRAATRRRSIAAMVTSIRPLPVVALVYVPRNVEIVQTLRSREGRSNPVLSTLASATPAEILTRESRRDASGR